MSSSHPNIPHLQKNESSAQLIVNGKPYLMLAAELQNSSLTSAEYMNTVWQELKDIHLNTILGCVTWEIIEPVEGQFDFSELDKVILGARAHGLHLVLLWFGSFKNGMSTYTPNWVKTDARRFPRAKLRKAGGILETGDVVSIFHPEAVKADARAFTNLMAYIKEIDEAYSTVLMVQVENETGLLGDSRDGGAAANRRFAEPVPKELINFLQNDWDFLHADLKANLKSFESLGIWKGSWEEVFGKSSQTDELFMAYHYALYLNEVAAAGKKEYPIPLYTNVWMNYVGEDRDEAFPVVVGGGGSPGDYPSGGSTSNVLDIWQNFAPNLDFIAPDVYLNQYGSSCAKYRHRNQPLFIPEQRRDEYGARRIWEAYGSYQALGTSPFGIDTLGPETNPFTKHYCLLESVSQVVLDAQRRPNSSVGFYFDELSEDGSDPSKPLVRKFGNYEIHIERCFVFGKPGPGAGMVIHLGGAKLLLIGWGFQVVARSLSPTSTLTGFLKFEEKYVADVEKGELKTLRTLNGDETRSGIFAMMPNEAPDYGGFPICVTIPARTMIAELEMYSIEEADDVD
ncbi:glycoside hydrolase family 35 protein [Zopfia rhizophila CBS 207.26]|uniref:Glycoside hydrolase family 35 protein n=1 Tax=Zopfia rhizophila CBS 207.26 TaxID=1314779 RepID=A0A6A6EB74_9PEZI|nr:glycoside hydrolase family 35 protein [Zopfia rhizophila CBS 207.26]